jgi:ribosomal protein S18 acetylase RimI-like enzyme
MKFNDYYFKEIEIYGNKKPFITKDESGQLEHLVDEIDSEDIRVLIGKEKLVKTLGNIDQTSSEYDGWRFLYRDNGKIVGAVQGVIMSDGTNVLSNIYVKDEYRKQGIGTKLVNIAKEHMKNLKASNDFTELGYKFFNKLDNKDKYVNQ